MKQLDRHNIFELIGKDRRKYHSAFITCYSYDFSFFEERILPVLRTANIKNVNVFTDGRYLESLLEHTTGKEFRANKTYTLTPVYPKGAFHPKLMLLLGVKQGLLIVGSGNLTGAGICSNDEVWGAFHLSADDNSHAALFAEAWKYFQNSKKHVKGFVNQSFDWINKHASWINSLKAESNAWSQLADNQRGLLLYNKPENNLLRQISSLIPKRNLETLTVISPFYDINGKLLSDLNSIFKPGLINSVVHTEFGSIPEKLNTSGIKVKFFEWEKVMDSACRLHAKIFHFRFNDNQEYLLLGSANASVAAFGSLQSNASNEEVCLLLNRKSNGSYLQELGIKIPKASVLLSDIEAAKLPVGVAELNLKSRISYVELEGKKLTLYFEKFHQADLFMVVFDTDGIEIERLPFKSNSPEATFIISSLEDAFKVAVYDTGQRISNFQLIHRVEFLIKNNPDPKQEKLDGLIEDLLSGNRDSIAELFTHLSYNWADDDEDTPKHGAISIAGSKKEKETAGTAYKKLKEDEFNTVSKEVLLKQSGILSNSCVKIAEFLGVLSGSLKEAEKEDFTESEESRQLNQGNSGEGDVVKGKKKGKTDAEKEQRAVLNFFWRLQDSYNGLLDGFYKSNGVDGLGQSVTIKSLSNMLIALEVFNLYYGKKFLVEQKDKDGNKTKKEIEFIPEGNIRDNENALWFLIDVLGKFLLLSVSGHRQYDYELLINKQKEMRWNLFAKSLFTICNVSWNERINAYRDTMLLNLLFLINPEDVSQDNFESKLQQSLKGCKEKAQKINSNYNQSIDYFFKIVLPKYRRWITVFSDSSKKSDTITAVLDLSDGSLVYKKVFGFVQLAKVIRSKPELNHLNLLAAGFEWDEEEEACLLCGHPNGNKIVYFE